MARAVLSMTTSERENPSTLLHLEMKNQKTSLPNIDFFFLYILFLLHNRRRRRIDWNKYNEQLGIKKRSRGGNDIN